MSKGRCSRSGYLAFSLPRAKGQESVQLQLLWRIETNSLQLVRDDSYDPFLLNGDRLGCQRWQALDECRKWAVDRVSNHPLLIQFPVKHKRGVHEASKVRFLDWQTRRYLMDSSAASRAA